MADGVVVWSVDLVTIEDDQGDMVLQSLPPLICVVQAICVKLDFAGIHANDGSFDGQESGKVQLCLCILF